MAFRRKGPQRALDEIVHLTERWREGSKWYSLNADRVDDTFRALSRFLQTKSS